MNMHKLRKLFVSGIAALSLVAVVACSGGGNASDPTVDSEPTTAQNVASTEVIDAATVAPADTATVAPSPLDIVTNIEPESDQEAEEVGGTISAGFDDDAVEPVIGDAVTEIAPEPAPDVAAEQLTPAEIVAAQSEHLADLYERTVQSVVFIVARTVQGVGSGSGFVWDTEGHIVTNYHVVQGATSLTVKFFSGREYTADVVAFDPSADLAVIKLNDVDQELLPIAIGNSSDLRPGEMAIALGNPFGEEFTMTTGIVSAVSRTIGSGFSLYSIPSVVQTDAAINPGNSGGPLLDQNGAVIGVNTQIRSESNQSSGVGFAVPVDLVKRVVPSLIENGEHEYSLMGISGSEINITVRNGIGLPGDINGAYITAVTVDGPADLAGLRQDTGSRNSAGILINGQENWDGDVIVSIDSVRIKSMDDLIGYLALNTAPGDEISVGVYRDGAEESIPMTLGSRPSTS